ncbi:MAG: hypothetical protein WCA77_01275, partial [Thermoplasmata archaeon]
MAAGSVLRRYIPLILGVSMIAVLIAAILAPASASVPVQATCPPYGTCPNSDSSTNNNLLYIGTAVALAIIVAAVAAALLI